MAISRNRSETSVAGKRDAWNITKLCNGSTLSHYTTLSAYHSTGTSRTMFDFVEVDYAKRVAAGEVFNHPMHSTKVEYGGENTSYYKITYTPTCTGTAIKTMEGNDMRGQAASYLGNHPDLIDTIEDLQMQVGTQVLAGIEEPDWNLPLFAAEIDKTFKMFRPNLMRALETLAKAQKDYRKEVRKNGKGLARLKLGLNTVNGLGNFIAGKWLQYRYGILPLIYDWEDFMKVANETDIPKRLTSRAKAKYVFDERSEEVVTTSDVYFTHTRTTKQNTSVTVRGGCMYEHDLLLKDRIGYSASNIIPTAWELVPFSFVVDWFVNAGDLIGAIQPKVGVKELARWTKTTIETVDESLTSSVKKTVANFLITGNVNASSVRTTTDVVRSPTLYVGVVPKWKYIDLKQSVHQKHLADSIALIKTLLIK